MSDLRTRIIGLLYDNGDMPASKAARLADVLIGELPELADFQPDVTGTINIDRLRGR